MEGRRGIAEDWSSMLEDRNRRVRGDRSYMACADPKHTTACMGLGCSRCCMGHQDRECSSVAARKSGWCNVSGGS